MSKCSHSRAAWGVWYEAVQGVTHMIEAQDKYCPDCDKVIERRTRNGRKL